jgi:hypothetical protein
MTSRHPHTQSVQMAVLVLLTLLATFALATSANAAEPPELLLRMPDDGKPGSGAGEIKNPWGVAANPVGGHVYVSDLGNARIDEFDAWGAFVRAWGWDVSPEGAPGDTPSDQLEVCTTVCKAGSEGDGVGQLEGPTGIAVDSAGAIYVHESANRRVQKFDTAGNFLLMFGGEVNKTTGADVCTKADVEGGDVCGTGVSGTADGFFSEGLGDRLAYDSVTDSVFIGDLDRIQEFNLDGTFKSDIDFEGELGAFDGKMVKALDADPTSGNLYISFPGSGIGVFEPGLYKLSPTGQPLPPGKPGESKFDVNEPTGIAVDVLGNVYAIEGRPVPGKVVPEVAVFKYDAAGNQLIPTQQEWEAVEENKSSLLFPSVPYQGPRLRAIATNLCAGSDSPGNLYIAYSGAGEEKLTNMIEAYGTAPTGCGLPPERAPIITGQYATSVGTGEATLQAEINPLFWEDTTYYVEYGTGKCSEGGCGAKAPIPASLLSTRVTNEALKTAAVFLAGLESGTTYHYRFVADSGGGAPVYGVDPDGEGPEEASFEDGAEKTFTTFEPPQAATPCANDAFRIGAGAKLPDCRAYEMVSPLDKENGDAAIWEGKLGVTQLAFELHQSAISGDRFTFTSGDPFANPQSAPFVSQYMAKRTGAGWGSESISPPQTQLPVQPTISFRNPYQGFSADLCQSWIANNSDAPLAQGAVAGFQNLYHREHCSETASLEALSTVEPPSRTPGDYTVRTVGISADGAHTLFDANDDLHEDAPVLGGTFERLLYEATPGGLRFVCYLPSGTPSPDVCAAGSAKDGSAHNAISADGQRIFWSAFGKFDAAGRIYARIGGEQTLSVSRAVANDPAWFWTAADDGSKVIFAFASGTRKGELYEFDIDAALAEEPTPARLIAEGAEGPMGASEDASRIYFSSTEDLDGGGPAGEGAHNLYLYEADPGGGSGTFTFVMALAASDVGGSVFLQAPIERDPAGRSAQVSADGLHATFTSVAPPPSGYDNLDAASGKPVQEVYRYDAEAGDLRCISCNPSGARPTSADVGQGMPGAARIQGWENLLRAPRVISEDGSRVFFESFEALVPRDTNGNWDVYQWEEPGAGTCTEDDPTYGSESGGCVELISSGESSRKSTFLDADPDGESVFIATMSSLVPQDYGLNDVYVARIGGGFAQPVRRAECEGEACQSPPAPPNDPTPASASFQGEGNVREGSPRKARRCGKGKRRVMRRGKARCVKKKVKQSKRANSNQRRASR